MPFLTTATQFFSTIWDIVWWFFSIFVFVAYLMALFTILIDLFRDRKLGGVAKAIWLVFLIFLPFLTALAYLIVRGGGMGDRAAQQAAAQRDATEDYIRSVAGSSSGATAASPAEEIARAKQLLDAGTITADEFATLKQAALRR